MWKGASTFFLLVVFNSDVASFRVVGLYELKVIFSLQKVNVMFEKLI